MHVLNNLSFLNFPLILLLAKRIIRYSKPNSFPVDRPFMILASRPPPAANARPSGLKRHSRGEDAFKEGRCIQGGNEAFKRN